MRRSAVLLIGIAIPALIGLVPRQAESRPAHRGSEVSFYGPHVLHGRFGIGFYGYRYSPHFHYRHDRLSRYSRVHPRYYRYYRPGFYVGAYPLLRHVPHRSHPSSQGYRAGSGAIRMMVDVKEAQVFVDGYYAGIVDDFDGTFQKLYLLPGEHTIELRLDGYRTFSQRILVSPNHTQKLHHRMVRLGPGETHPEPSSSALDPAGPPRQRPPSRQEPSPARAPSSPTVEGPSTSAPSPSSSTSPAAVRPDVFGILRLRVQPAEGEIHIDGEPWGALEGLEEIAIHLPAGMHRIELHRAGTSVFATDVEIQHGETTPLNIRLPT